MLVIISDLHLTDGTSGETIAPHAFRIFRNNLGDMVYEASWRADGKYRPIDEVHLVLLGDILDLIRSTTWLAQAPDVRPWGDPNSQGFVNTIRTISDAVLQKNADALAVIRGLSNGAITLPPAENDKPAKVGHEPDARGRLPVRVNVHYLVGNHDWFYHLTGSTYDQAREPVRQAMGLSNPRNTPFPHDPSESSVIQQIYEEHSVFARHGDIFDSFNYEGKRDASSLGDAIVVELLNRFPEEVRQKLGGTLPQVCLNGLREIDNVRPLLIIPVWINGFLRSTCPDRDQVKQVKAIWDGLVDEFLNLPFVRAHDSVFNLFDNVDKLEWALKFSQGVSLGNLSHFVTWIKEKLAGPGDAFYRNAFTEPTFRSRKARFIVYGHTHHQEIVPLDAAIMPSGILRQMYFNSGTWRRVHELARLHPDEQEFMGYHVMTYLAFFRGDERGGRPFESWSGALGVLTPS